MEQTDAKEPFHRDADSWNDERHRVDVYVDGLTGALAQPETDDYQLDGLVQRFEAKVGPQRV